MIETEKICKDIGEILRKELAKHNLKIGGPIWVLRNGCYECPFEDDHCQIDCKRKNVKYIEQTKIKSVNVRLSGTEEKGKKTLGIYVDESDSESVYNLADYGNTFFTDRNGAVEKMIQLRENPKEVKEVKKHE